MKVTLLGTGTSQGIPVIGCNCTTCLSEDPRDSRLRSGVLVEDGDTNILIDTGPDLRQQMLSNRVERVDAILYTHEHNDHVIGLDDIRPFNFAQRTDMPLYAQPRVGRDLKLRFDYVFRADAYPGAPRAVLHQIENAAPFTVKGVRVTPIPIYHGKLPILSYRINDFVFMTDASQVPEDSYKMLKGVKVLVINALRKEPHHSHFSLQQALDVIGRINPERAYLTHLSHRMGPISEWASLLPDNVSSSYDGLQFDI